jgi:hypothetical protein
MSGHEWCYIHNPATEERRKRTNRKGGKRGGRGRPMAELSDLKAQLSALYASVLGDMVEPKTGAVLAQITNAQIRITEVELKVKEQAELEGRLEELERALDEREREGGYGA